MSPGSDGAPTGLTGTPAANAFRDAGIAVTWMMAPTNRQLAMVKDPQQPSCAVGWFRNAERERFARFTKPIYRDKNWILLANAGYTMPEGATLEQLLQNPETRILVKENYSYGPDIDAMIVRGKATVAVSAGSTDQLLQSVSGGAVDFMFVSEEEGQYAMSRRPGASGPQNGRGAGLRLLRPKGLPHGAERHIMCGKSVPDSVIERLNKAITFR
ncbi:hypothetical protein GCM10027277_55650 [Pseudoduganella ginsengisoli]|uniref:hypothetical protein n=1 Tax=Pseudoduganella ginsengisoli TaxID=1462440 RepID=UPI001E65B8D1